MFLVDRQTVPATLRDAAPIRLKLRVREGGQEIELAAGKTTIGSSPRCNLRLDRPGVEPLHCLLTDGPDGLRVRRWAADTRLNGEPVEEAALEAGDCLALGGVELELVGPVAVDDLNEKADLLEKQVAELVAEQAAADQDHELLWQPLATPLLSYIQLEEARQSEIENHADEGPQGAFYAEAIVESDLEVAAEDVLPSLEVPASEVESADVTIEEAAVEAEQILPSCLPESDAAEFVFRELQSACSVARGRNRKLLAALRSLRAEKETLVRRMEDGEPSEEFARDLANWDATRQQAEQEQRELHVELKELRRQLGEWEGRLADHTQRMAELQQELVATRAGVTPVVENHVLPQDTESYEPTPLADLHAEVPFAAEHSLMASDAWEAVPVDAAEPVAAEQYVPELSNRVQADELPIDAEPQPIATEEVDAATDFICDAAVPWNLPVGRKVEQEIAELAPSVRPDPQVEEAPAEEMAAAVESADPWDMPTERKADWTVSAVPAVRDDASAAGAISMASEESADDLSPFAKFSIWKQGAQSEPTSFEEPESLRDAEAAADVSAIWGGGSFGEAGSDAAEPEAENPFLPAKEANPWAVSKSSSDADENAGSAQDMERSDAPVQSASFIERYSHLFAEETDSTPAAKIEPSFPQPVRPAPSSSHALTGPAPIPTSGGDDEESIEQYMAKLMRRVRGDNPAVPESTPPVPAEEEKPEAVVPASSHPEEPQNEANPAEVGETGAEQSEVAVNWDAFVRRAATAPATDLGALRALANATARRDINVHQLKRHRRDAKTKVIVSMLAGMTSLWLMLDAGNWRSLQFITACVSLIVAAWWAGEALREMLRSMRVTYVGPGAGDVDASLPIDVEG